MPSVGDMANTYQKEKILSVIILLWGRIHSCHALKQSQMPPVPLWWCHFIDNSEKLFGESLSLWNIGIATKFLILLIKITITFMFKYKSYWELNRGLHLMWMFEKARWDWLKSWKLGFVKCIFDSIFVVF